MTLHPSSRLALRLSLTALGLSSAVLGLVPVNALAPETASAYVVGGQTWPHGRIPYAAVNARLRDSARIAAGWWNHSGARVHFVEVPRSRARVIVRFAITPTGGGFASLGYLSHGAFVGITRGQERNRDILAHEFGHVLGLNHSPLRCVSMNTNGLGSCPTPRHSWQTACEGLRLDDIRGAVRRYGGHVGRGVGTFCDIAPPPSPPRPLGVDPGVPVERIFRPIVRLRVPGRYVDHVEVTRFTGTCPATDAEAGRRKDRHAVGDVTIGEPLIRFYTDRFHPPYRRKVLASKAVQVRDGDFPRVAARYCYRLVAVDIFSRRGRAATLFYDHKPPPPVPPKVSVVLTPSSGEVTQDQYGSASVDAEITVRDDGYSSTASVDWGDGGRSRAIAFTRTNPTETTTHAFDRPGTYALRVSVVDDDGITTTVTRQITVRPGPPPPPDPPPPDPDPPPDP